MFTKFFSLSPLEQFEVFYFLFNHPEKTYLLEQFIATSVGGTLLAHQGVNCYPYSNAFFTLVIIIFSVLYFSSVVFLNWRLISTKSAILFDQLMAIISGMIRDLAVTSASFNYYLPFFILVFLLVAIINLLGLIPYTFVLTSQFFFTFGLAFLFFITLNLTGIVLHGFKFFNLFYPTGTPLFIVPLLVLIELVSYIARVFSLAIRLFANITAGHILVKILSWLTWMVVDFILLSSLSFVIISSLWVLEFFISVLQAYVFLTLLCLYLNDVLVLH